MMRKKGKNGGISHKKPPGPVGPEGFVLQRDFSVTDCYQPKVSPLMSNFTVEVPMTSPSASVHWTWRSEGVLPPSSRRRTRIK